MMRGEWYRLRDDLVAQHGELPPRLLAEKGAVLQCCSEQNINGYAGKLWIERRGHAWPVRERDIDHVPVYVPERKTKR